MAFVVDANVNGVVITSPPFGRLDAHFHALCRVCGRIIDVPVDYDESLDQMVEKETGFKVDRHRTLFEGVCAECLKRIDKTED